MEHNFLTLDWLAFTYHIENSFDQGNSLEQFLHAFPFINREDFVPVKMRSHYSANILWCDIVISYNELTPDIESEKIPHLVQMGVNVQIPSHCLCFWFNKCGVSTENPDHVALMFSYLKERNCKFSRVDLCFDDYRKVVTTGYYRKKWVDGCIQSPFINSVTCMGSETKGYTMYFGSLKKRTKLLRIYDKFLESKGEKDCVRYEFELHAEQANGIANLVLNEYSDGIPFAPFLLSWICVKDEISVHNCARIQDAKDDMDWIVALTLNLTLKYKIKIPVESNKSELTYFVEHQAISSIAGFVMLYGKEAFDMLVKDAIKRGNISPRYLSFINKLKRSNEFEDCYSNPFDDPQLF